jgi:arsenate reductase-like glutaredoxin family protein
MKTWLWLLLAAPILLSFTLVQRQRTPVEKNKRETVQQEQLKRLMSKVGIDVLEIAARTDQTPTYRELKINWTDPTKSTTELRSAVTAEQQTPSPRVSVVEDKKRSGTLPRHRSLELSPTHIFIAGVDAADKLRWWSIVPDPRLVRGETQTPTGELRGEEYYVSNVTLLVAFPDDPEIANLRFFHPVWNGTDFDLKPLAVVPTR